MNLDLAIIGRGAVSPAGLGVEALRKGHPTPTLAAELRRPDQSWPVLRIDPKTPELLRWQLEPRLRRASPITLYLIEAAAQALVNSSAANREQTGLIIAFSAGCLVYSRRFFEGLTREGRNLASPALFPETVFNSPGSHVAAALKLNGAVYALVGDQSTWAAALQTAAIWLREKRVQQVLVLGAEEFDPLALDAYAIARWLRRSPGATSFLPSEGAGGVLVRPAQSGDTHVISAARDGFIYRTRKQAATAAENLFRSTDKKLPCLPTAQGTWLAPLEEKMLSQRTILCDEKLPSLGQAFTASAAWDIIRASERLSPTTPNFALPLWGLNHQLSVIEFSNTLR